MGKKKADPYSSHESANRRSYVRIQAGIFPKENNCGKLTWPPATSQCCKRASAWHFCSPPCPGKGARIVGVIVLSNELKRANQLPFTFCSGQLILKASCREENVSQSSRQGELYKLPPKPGCGAALGQRRFGLTRVHQQHFHSPQQPKAQLMN